MARLNLRKKQAIDTLVSGLPYSAYQKNPFFPDLLKQPDILMIPRRGKMVVTFMYASPQHIGWHSALAWVEDLIEVKLNVGDYVITTALVFAESDEVTMKPDVRQLLSSTFEEFLLPHEWKPPFFDHVLYQRLVTLEPKHTLDNFLHEERYQASKALDRFGPERYARLVDRNREPEHHPRELAAVVRARLSLPSGEQLEERPLVPNIKGYLGKLGRRYSFEFDLGIGANVAIEVIRAERYGSREKIRYLMAKARMLRYEVDGDRLYSRGGGFRPVLIVDGNLSGPDHDPYRYVRALLSVGWELFSIDQLALLAEMLGHGHV
jgi:hypothetical protein